MVFRGMPRAVWAVALLVALSNLALSPAHAARESVVAASPVASALSLCGNAGPAPGPVEHVIVLMMENLSYKQVVGSSNAPFQTSLSRQCGNPQAFFSATHSSAANYLATSAGQFPPTSPPGCGTLKACANNLDNLYSQLSRAGLDWAGYMEAMPFKCAPASSGPVANGHAAYSVGHNPIVFFKTIPASECAARDIAVSDLTAQSGPFWNALQNQTLPAFSWVTPSAANDNEGGSSRAEGEQIGDAFLQKFVGNLQQSNSYQAGNTLVVITYDEGLGSDSKIGQDCTDKSRDLPVVNHTSAHQESCHIPTFVLYPYTSPGDADPAFFDLYSLTRTVEDLFGLSYLAHAGDAQTESLVGHFGIPARATDVHPSVAITGPDPGTPASGTVTVSGTSRSDQPITGVTLAVDDGTPQPATGTESWTRDLDTTALTDGDHTLTATATDATGDTGTATTTITVANSAPLTQPIGFVGDATSSANTRTARVVVPTPVQVGDQLILIGSYGLPDSRPTTPPGWTLASTRLNGAFESFVWTRRATTTDAGTPVSTPTSTSMKSTLVLAAYRNLATTGALADIASSTDTNTANHTSPTATAPAGGWVLRTWTDKSSGTTAWTPPPGLTTRETTFGSGSGETSALLTDSGTPVPAGPTGTTTATSNSVSSKGITWTITLKPAS